MWWWLMRHRFSIPGTLPTLNEYVTKERTNRFMAAKAKREAQDYIEWAIKASHVPAFTDHVYIGFVWIRPDARSDKDNVTFAKKFILDALQEADVIKRDSWKLCTPYDLGYAVNKRNPRTIVIIADSYEELMADA